MLALRTGDMNYTVNLFLLIKQHVEQIYTHVKVRANVDISLLLSIEYP